MQNNTTDFTRTHTYLRYHTFKAYIKDPGVNAKGEKGIVAVIQEDERERK